MLIADERVAERFTAPADEVERFMYGWSVLHCLPATIDESDAVANGTVLRESTVRDWAHQAGFHHVQTLPIDNDFWRFYRLDAGPSFIRSLSPTVSAVVTPIKSDG